MSTPRSAFRPAWRVALAALLLVVLFAVPLVAAAEPAAPPHEHTSTDGVAAPRPSDAPLQPQRPRFAQHHTANRAYHQALRNLQQVQEQMRSLAQWGRSFSPFESLFGGHALGGGLDPFFGRGRGLGLGAPRPRSHAWPSLWSDPFFDAWPELNEWPSEYDAHDSHSPAGALTADQGHMGQMLTSSFDVREEPDSYTIDARVPGWKPEELDVHIEGNELRLSGERKSEQTTPGSDAQDPHQPSSHVKSYSYFTKRYRLPDDFKAEDLSASFSPQDSRLRVQLRKPHAALAPPKPTRIPVPLHIDQAQPHQPTPSQPTKTFDDQPPAQAQQDEGTRLRIHDELRR